MLLQYHKVVTINQLPINKSINQSLKQKMGPKKLLLQYKIYLNLDCQKIIRTKGIITSPKRP